LLPLSGFWLLRLPIAKQSTTIDSEAIGQRSQPIIIGGVLLPTKVGLFIS